MSKKMISFLHDCNARNHPKIIALRMQHGMEGYGVYFGILEILGQNGGFYAAFEYYELAFALHSTAKMVQSIVEDFGLFSIDEEQGYFCSESQIYSMMEKDDISEKRRIAGRKGAAKRWGNKQKMAKE